MANISPVVTHDSHTAVTVSTNTTVNGLPKGTMKVFWEALTSTNTQGVGAKISHYGDKNVQLTGTFTTTTIVIEGSNDSTNGVDGTWYQLVDPQGNALSFTAAGGEQLLENPLWIRPRASASGGATDVDVTVIASTPRQA